MTPAIPPRTATWLLVRLASGPQRSALAGDLAEQYQRHRSAGWYWWQVLTAIAVSAVQDIGDHLVLVVRAVAVWYVLSRIVARVTIRVHELPGLVVWNWTVAHGFDTLRVAWFGRPWYNPFLLVATCLNAVAIGWIVARFHRRHLAATTLSCMASNVVYVVAARQFWDTLWPVTFETAPFVATIPFVVALVGAPIGLFLGALLASDATDTTSPDVVGTGT